jgi:hypothetical protein
MEPTETEPWTTDDSDAAVTVAEDLRTRQVHLECKTQLLCVFPLGLEAGTARRGRW